MAKKKEKIICHCGLPIIEDNVCKYCKITECKCRFRITKEKSISIISIEDIITEEDIEEALA